ncbi:MAG: ShlB/FhaC/HecB family hemolysin secretion/activation protein [Potamolinea sp.]
MNAETHEVAVLHDGDLLEIGDQGNTEDTETKRHEEYYPIPNPQSPITQLPSLPTLPQPDRREPPSQKPQPPQTPTPLPPPEQLLQPLPSTPRSPDPIPGKVPETITVERFEFEGNTAISSEELAKITEKYLNRAISFAELFQVRSEITKLYVDKGYITSGALIPPQTLTGGVVKIQIVEGGVESINVKGTRRLRTEYVRSRLRLVTGKPLNQKRLLEALQLLQLNPLIENISAELAAGTEPGLSILEVQVKEAKTFRTQFSVDNNRSPSVGTVRRRLQATEANLLGYGDGLTLTYNNTDGSNGGDLNYTFPINPRNGTLSFSYGTTTSQVIEPPFERIDIESNSRYYELSIRQPLFQSPTEEFAIGVTATRQESESSLLDIPFPLSPGADDQGRTRITSLRFFQEWTKRSSTQVLAARSQFSTGIRAFGSTINEQAPDSRYFSWRGQAQMVRLLGPETLLLVRGDMQLANKSLVPFEQFGLGGQASIRGYRQDILLTDNGALLSAELRLPILRLRETNSLLQIAPFVELGSAWNSSNKAAPDPNFLASVGLGLQLQLGDRVSARLDYGIPLVSVSSNKRTWQESGFYFSLIVNPF